MVDPARVSRSSLMLLYALGNLSARGSTLEGLRQILGLNSLDSVRACVRVAVQEKIAKVNYLPMDLGGRAVVSLTNEARAHLEGLKSHAGQNTWTRNQA